ncbi:universal stress protein [Haloferacaceae archaeon DSL9]
MPRRILVPMDGSSQSNEALSYALETFPDAELVVAHVLNPVDGMSAPDGIYAYAENALQGQQERAEGLFERAKDAAGPGQVVETELLAGSPARAIVEYAEDEDNEIDGIVMGSHGRDGAARLLLGSVAETVVRRSPVPVTVVR